jgi:acetyl-CoA carboxylase biotin carboxyl carrier protein
VKPRGWGTAFLPDADLVRSLAQLLAETGLSEIEYAVGDRRIRVARNAAQFLRDEPPAAVPAGIAVEANGKGGPLDLSCHPGAITAPMVGTAYLAPEPGAAPFVRVGEEVDEGQAILIIEAMKVMNQIRAPRPGRVRRVLVADGAPVEYGAALMVIE